MLSRAMLFKMKVLIKDYALLACLHDSFLLCSGIP